MTTYTIDISCTGPTPAETDAHSGDKIVFNNTTGASVTITFSGTGVLNPSPHGSATIAANDNKRFTVGSTKGTQDFSYPDCGDELGVRSGKIVIS
jgi:plastocyanin